jgi:biopolymer transport protein ExbD
MQPVRSRTIEAGFQLTPMIDMTFLLLIFFMVTQKITEQQINMEVKLPVAASARTPDDISEREVINLQSDGSVYVGERKVSINELRTHLKQRLAKHPPLRMYVRADADTDSTEIKRIMRTCAEAGAIEIIFGTHKQD